MSTIDIDAQRARLEEERTRLSDAVRFLARENPGSLEDELGEIAAGNDNHLGDMATATFDRELDEGLGERAQQTLADIGRALTKIDDGSYGTCEVCGKAIAPERLKAIPWARLCIDDQRRRDG